MTRGRISHGSGYNLVQHARYASLAAVRWVNTVSCWLGKLCTKYTRLRFPMFDRSDLACCINLTYISATSTRV